MKHVKNLFSICLFLISVISFSQDKPYQDDNTKYYYSSSNGDVSNPQFTTVPATYQESPEKRELLSKLHEARISNDMQRARVIAGRLNELDGIKPAPFVNNPSETGIIETHQQFTGEGDGITLIDGSNYWAIATQTSHLSQHIFAAVTEYNSSGGDRIKVYVSYNRGVNWILKGTWTGFNSTVKCVTDELDIEPVIYGADTMLFVVAGYKYNNNNFSLIARFNIGTGTVLGQAFSLSSTSTKNYNPRVTSDNTVYSSGAYVYITVANDTLLSANNHRLRQRLCMIMDPFAAFTQVHTMPNPAFGAFYWHAQGIPDNAYMSQDVAYYFSSVDNTSNIYCSVTFPGYTNVYSAWCKNFGTSIAGNLTITETLPVSRVRLAFNGGLGNRNGAMLYLRNYSSNPSGDVDVKCQNTTSGGTTVASYVPSWVEYTSDTATTCDIQAVKMAVNKFKFAYGVLGYRCYYKSNTGTSAYSTPLLVNNLEGIRVKAGYRIAPTDSCLAIWSKSDGTGMYSTYGCDNYIGITPNINVVPDAFSLSQNYPNPFNPVTNIKFSIPHASFVKLTVYDITGREVTRLVNQQLNTGAYTVDFDASHLSSGIYLYRIETESFSDVKKMMLVK